ncbi:MAG: hypothetical protein ACTSQE_07405 [Candidatus Heimdallarchaeaceae archaeon]
MSYNHSPSLEIEVKTITSGLIQELLPSKRFRQYLMIINNSESSIKIAYQNSQPSVSQMADLGVGGKDIFFDYVPISKVWVYQESGSDITVQVREE